MPYPSEQHQQSPAVCVLVNEDVDKHRHAMASKTLTMFLHFLVLVPFINQESINFDERVFSFDHRRR